jgi:hypothetical protein
MTNTVAMKPPFPQILNRFPALLARSLFLLVVALALLLQHLLDDLLLLDKEGPNNTVPDAVTAS